MPREIEIKHRLREPPLLRERLQALGARPEARTLECSTILDTVDGALLGRDAAVRVRHARSMDESEPGLATLTYKGPRDAGAVKGREEIECYCDDPAAALAILLRLGLVERVYYERRRESWRLGECEIAIDELPDGAWFAETEGPDEQAVARTAASIGLIDADRADETYVAYAARVGTLDAAGVVRLAFRAR